MAAYTHSQFAKPSNMGGAKEEVRWDARPSSSCVCSFPLSRVLTLWCPPSPCPRQLSERDIAQILLSVSPSLAPVRRPRAVSMESLDSLAEVACNEASAIVSSSSPVSGATRTDTATPVSGTGDGSDGQVGDGNGGAVAGAGAGAGTSVPLGPPPPRAPNGGPPASSSGTVSAPLKGMVPPQGVIDAAKAAAAHAGTGTNGHTNGVAHTSTALNAASGMVPVARSAYPWAHTGDIQAAAGISRLRFALTAGIEDSPRRGMLSDMDERSDGDYDDDEYTDDMASEYSDLESEMSPRRRSPERQRRGMEGRGASHRTLVTGEGGNAGDRRRRVAFDTALYTDGGARATGGAGGEPEDGEAASQGRLPRAAKRRRFTPFQRARDRDGSDDDVHRRSTSSAAQALSPRRRRRSYSMGDLPAPGQLPRPSLPPAFEGLLSPDFAKIYNSGGRVGIYTPEERLALVRRFHEKRLRRVWSKKIRYDCRKNLADRRVRVKGRFVKAGSAEAIAFLEEQKAAQRGGGTSRAKGGKGRGGSRKRKSSS